MNMFKKNAAKTVKEYLAAVPAERKADIDFLHGFIQKTVPKLKPYFTNMISYGKFQYLDKKTKQARDWQIIGLANQKAYISLYICGIEDGQGAVEKYAKELGKVTVGRGCMSFKKVSDVDLPTLKKVLKVCEKSPGVLGATLV